MKWKELLADKSVADDVQITVGSNTFTMGQLRAANSESEGELASRLDARKQELDRQQSQQEQAVNNFAQILTKVSEVTGLPIEKIISGDVSGVKAAVAPQPGDDFWNKEEYKPIKAKLDPLEKKMGDIATALSNVVKVYMNDHAALEFERYKMPELPKDAKPITLETALAHAMQNKYLDSVGRPNVRKSLDELTQSYRQQKTEEQIRADEREKARKEFEMAQFAQPQGGAGGIQFDSSPAKGNSKDIPTIQQQLDAAFKDASILQSLRTQ